MEMYEQSFYLAAVNHGREFELIFKHRDTFRVHSVFTHAINLVAGSEFLTVLPLARGCGRDAATVAVSGDFSFLTLGVSIDDYSNCAYLLQPAAWEKGCHRFQ